MLWRPPKLRVKTEEMVTEQTADRFVILREFNTLRCQYPVNAYSVPIRGMLSILSVPIHAYVQSFLCIKLWRLAPHVQGTGW